MIVVDTSVWVALLRRTESAAHRRLRTLLDDVPDELATTEVVVAELLAGATSASLPDLRARLLAFPILQLGGLRDYEAAAALYRACRNAGEGVRQITDCLVAVATIRAGGTLLQADRDFEKLARHTPLRLEPV